MEWYKFHANMNVNNVTIKKMTKTKIRYCVVIPFDNREDYLEALEPLKNTRKDIQKWKLCDEWFVDGIVINEEEYKKLIKKSQATEIVNELEEIEKES